MHHDAPLPIAPDAPWLAPLAGYSDLPFRLLCREHGAAAAVTEMVSAKGLCYNSKGSEDLLTTIPGDAPLVVQLFASEEDSLARAMDMLLERGFRWFDLNAGCPVRKVLRTGCGAALLEDLDLLTRLAGRMAAMAGPGRCGVKLRRARTPGNDSYLEAGKRLEQAGTAWLALHPRDAKQGYAGTADWGCLREMVRAVGLPVIASGDLFSAEDGVRCLAETGAAGVMYARGALYGPQIFSRHTALLQGREAPGTTRRELAETIRRHAALARQYLPDRMALVRMRTSVPRYVRHLPGSRALRNVMVRCTSWEELDGMVEDFLLDNGGQ